MICASFYSLKKAKPILVYGFIHVSEVVVVDPAPVLWVRGANEGGCGGGETPPQ